MLENRIKSQKLTIASIAEQSKNLYVSHKYLELISLVNRYKALLDVAFLNYSYFNDKVICLMYQGLCYIALGDYQRALSSFLSIENKYSFIKADKAKSKKLLKRLHGSEYRSCSELMDFANGQILNFNKNNASKVFSNIAFAYYKLTDYESACIYYKKALIRDKKNLQLHIEISQAKYRKIEKELKALNYKKLSKKDRMKLHYEKEFQKIEYNKTLKLFVNSPTTFDNLLAIGKLYYFLENYTMALIYVQNALKKSNKIDNKIFAYDWLSRIAYKNKKYSVAVDFYEKLIDLLVDNTGKTNDSGEIHPLPRLSDMVKYLNETKEKVAERDVHYINKSIWAAIAMSIIYGSLELYQTINEYFRWYWCLSFCILTSVILGLAAYWFIIKYKWNK